MEGSWQEGHHNMKAGFLLVRSNCAANSRCHNIYSKYHSLVYIRILEPVNQNFSQHSVVDSLFIVAPIVCGGLF